MAHQTVAIEVAMSTFNRKRQIMEQEPSTQNEIIEMAMEAEFVSRGKLSEEESELFVCTDKDIVRFAKLVAAKEREACALICDDHHEIWRFGEGEYSASGPKDCAAAIRARGEA
jgi:hypothetical protein